MIDDLTFLFSWWEESFALHAIVLGAGMMLSCNSCPDGLSGVQPNEEQASQPIDVGDPMRWGERTNRLLKSDMSLFGLCMFALWSSNLREGSSTHSSFTLVSSLP